MPNQSYMDSEIRAIMAQYMPLENQETPNQHRPVEHADIWNCSKLNWELAAVSVVAILTEW